jgi:riboflavin kinase/FMN adenylyltransferase
MIRTLDLDAAPLPSVGGGAVAVGNFDGLHLGHAALVAELVQSARAVGGPAVVLSFDPPPVRLLAPAAEPPRLTTPADRAELLPAMGVDHLLLLRTTPELLRLSPEEFFDRVVVRMLAAKAVVEGFNFRFGHGRAGDVDRLRTLCAAGGVACTIVPPLNLDDHPISSSRIREALLAGDVRGAARCLGRPYRLRGVVVEGARRGRTLGFPTANLDRFETLVPQNGVYAVRAWVDGQAWPAAANVGPNPTFGVDARKVEVHLIGYRGDLYGRPMAIDFVERLRDTRPFAGRDELVGQLRRDVERAAEECQKS